MVIGVLKEIKDHENRVALTPEAVRSLKKRGHRILVERFAGEGSGYADEAYESAGAEIAADRARLFGESELIVKVKEPLPPEYSLFQKGQILFAFLHLAANRELTQALLERGVIAVAFETIQLPDGTLPVLRPMSEIAGRMAVLMGAYYLQKIHGGRGVLLPGVPGIPPALVVILGGGTVGTHAARVAVGLGCRVMLFDRETSRLRHLDDLFGGRLVTNVAETDRLEAALPHADLLIGAVLVAGAKGPQLVSRRLVAAMPKGSVIVDVSIDQGGCVETSRPTSHSDPVFVEEGVVHYCVTNMPAAYPRTATRALVNEALPFLIEIADQGIEEACRRNAALAKGLNLFRGEVRHAAVAQAHGMKF